MARAARAGASLPENMSVHPIGVVIIELSVVAFFFIGWILWSRRKRQQRGSSQD
jgi:hypothetical protein